MEPMSGEASGRSERCRVRGSSSRAIFLSKKARAPAGVMDTEVGRRLPPSPDGLSQPRRGRDGGLPRKDLLQQHPVRFLVAVRAAIADDQQPVVRIGGMAQGREYDAAGGDPRQDQGLDAVGAQYQVEIGPGEGAHPMLGDDDFLGQRRDGGMNLRILGTRAECARGLEPVERRISVADLRIAGAEADDHIDHPYPGRARRVDQLRRPIEQLLRTGGIVVDDQRLEIHDKQRARPGIDRKIVCHCGPAPGLLALMGAGRCKRPSLAMPGSAAGAPDPRVKTNFTNSVDTANSKRYRIVYIIRIRHAGKGGMRMAKDETDAVEQLREPSRTSSGANPQGANEVVVGAL